MNTALLLLLFAAPPFNLSESTLNLKNTYDAGEPIVIGCMCAPSEGVTIQAQWKVDKDVSLKDASQDGLTKYAWAVPGKHLVEVQLFMARTHKVKVRVPDADHPEDITKDRIEELTVLDGWEMQKLSGEFTQLGTVTPAPPGPAPMPPPPGPEPTPMPLGIKGAVLMWEHSKLPAPKAAGDIAVGDYLTSQCGGNWRRWDDDEGSLTNPPKDLVDLWVSGRDDRSKAGKGNDDPWVQIELKDGRKVGRSMDDNTLQFLKSYGG